MRRRLTRLAPILAVASALLLGIQTPASANAICNGSFEDPNGPQPGNFEEIVAPSTAIPCWVVTTGTIDVAADFNYESPDGSYSIDLSGTPDAGAIAQTFATVVGVEYFVSFDFAGNPNGDPGVKDMRVSAGGQSQDFSFDTTGHTPAEPGWVRQFWSFTAVDTSSTLEFMSLELEAPTNFGPTIDNVVVPEPSSLLLFSLALGALLLRRA